MLNINELKRLLIKSSTFINNSVNSAAKLCSLPIMILLLTISGLAGGYKDISEMLGFGKKDEVKVETIVEQDLRVYQNLNKQYDNQIFDYGNYKVSGDVNLTVTYPKNAFDCYGKIDVKTVVEDNFSSIIDNIIEENLIKTYYSEFGMHVEQALNEVMKVEISKGSCNGQMQFEVLNAKARVFKQYNETL